MQHSVTLSRQQAGYLLEESSITASVSMVLAPTVPVTSRYSINQSDFYSANILGTLIHWHDSQVSVQRQNPKRHQWAIGHADVYRRRAKSKRCVFRHFLKVAIEGTEWTNSGRLFHRKRPQKWNTLESALVLTLGTDRVVLSCYFNEQDGSHVASIACRQTCVLQVSKQILKSILNFRGSQCRECSHETP